MRGRDPHRRSPARRSRSQSRSSFFPMVFRRETARSLDPPGPAGGRGGGGGGRWLISCSIREAIFFLVFIHTNTIEHQAKSWLLCARVHSLLSLQGVTYLYNVGYQRGYESFIQLNVWTSQKILQNIKQHVENLLWRFFVASETRCSLRPQLLIFFC